MKVSSAVIQVVTLASVLSSTTAFVLPSSSNGRASIVALQSTATSPELALEKKKLLGLLRTEPVKDDVLADPVTKEGVTIYTKGPMLADSANKQIYEIKSPTETYAGSSDSFIDLLEPVAKKSESPSAETTQQQLRETLVRNLSPFVPPPLRSAFAATGLGSEDYIPMRDLFTSPSVSFAYERGWRQSFSQAGFPGPDQEAEMAMDYFVPSMSKYSNTRTLVDMSCATGLFTRRFVKSEKYKRVLGCDYSASMLQQARQFCNDEKEVQNIVKKGTTRLDLVRLDVGAIPMKDESVDALHAGAAMHCWPDLVTAIKEIHRVLKPGGRYFATTFLSSYFATLQQADGTVGANQPSRQAFQYFGSVDQMKTLMLAGGFKEENISIEILGNACIAIRCEKE